jgi:hypothetical protein
MTRIGFILSLFGALIVSTTAAAAVDESLNSDLRVTVRVGDKVSTFLVKPDAGTARTISFKSTTGEAFQHKLKSQDWSYILSQFDKLPKVEVSDKCRRSRIDIEVKNAKGAWVSKSGCFGMPTPSENKFVHFANLLAMAI